jgi:pimeloyl-ACP methyl ester carboxylesterase
VPFIKRWLRRAAVAFVALVLALTVASLVYNAVTSGRDVAASKLYAGPYVLVDGTKLAYRTWGSHGSPIVLLGGFIEPSWVWHEVGPILARDHRVYALDLPPFGYSQRRGPFTVARWTQLVVGFDRHLGIHKPVVVGHSLGAAVAVSAAVGTPRSLGGVVLLDGDALPVGGPGWLAHLLQPPWYTSLYRIATGWNWLFDKGLQGAWGPGKPPTTAAFLDEWQRPFRVSGTAAAFASMLGHGIQGVSASTISQVRVPALVAWGSRDTVDSVAAGRHTAELMHAPFVEIQGAGHLSMLRRPDAVARAIERVYAIKAAGSAK